MKKIISLFVVAMMLVSAMVMVVSADTSVDVPNLPASSDFSPAGYEANVLHIGANGDSKSIGTWDLSGVTAIKISYGTDHTVATIAENNVYVQDAEGNTIGQAKLEQPYIFWAQGQRIVEVAIDSDYNGEIFITKDDPQNQMAIDAITFVGEATGGETGGEADDDADKDNPETGDAAIVAIVAVATIALAGVAVSKKVRA